MKKLVAWLMMCFMLVSLLIVKNGEVDAIQKKDTKTDISLNSNSSVVTSSREGSESSLSLKSESVYHGQESSKEEANSSIFSKSTSSSDLPSIESVKDSQNRLTQIKKGSTKATAIDDGIHDWTPTVQTDIEGFKIDNDKTLKYTFGNDDGTLTSGDTSGGNMLPKFNIFLDDNGTIVESVYLAKQGMPTSYDFGLQPDRTSDEVTIDGNSVVKRFMSYEFYKGTTDAGKIALKVVGEINTDNGHYQVELLLRPADEQPVIQQEIYIMNLDSQTYESGVFFAKDSQVAGNDYVPVFAQANNAGMYLETDLYKMFMNMNITDGPKHYSAAVYTSTGGLSGSIFGLKGYDSADFDSGGADNRNLAEGDTIFDAGDSTYSNKWGWTEFKPDEVNHFRTDLGMVSKGVVVPAAAVSYQNNTSQDNENHILDELTIKLKTHNIGFDSDWDEVQVTGPIPEELDIDKDSIKVENNAGDTLDLDASSYSEKNRKITVKLPQALTDNQWGTVVFNAKINKKASGETITQKMHSEGGSTVFSKATAEKKIPVVLSPTDLEKKVKNVTEKETEYKKEIVGHAKDILEYQVRLTVSPKGTDMVNAILGDDLANKKITLVPDSVKLEYSDSTTETPKNVTSVALKKMVPGEFVILTYRAKINEDAIVDKPIRNTITYIGEQANTGATGNQDEAIVNVEKPKISKIHFRYVNRAMINADGTYHENAEIGDKNITVTGQIGDDASKWKDDGAIVDGGQDPDKIRPAYIEGYTPVDYLINDRTTPEAIMADLNPIIEGDETTYTIRYEKIRLAVTALPTKMNFGKFYDTQSDRTFYLPAMTANPREGDRYQKTPYGIEVTDYWGIKSWALTVEQKHQFQGVYKPKNQVAQTVTLKDAKLQFNNAQFTIAHTEDKESPSGEKDDVTSKKNFELAPGAGPKEIVEYVKNGQYLKDKDENGKEMDNTQGIVYDRPGYSVYKYQFSDEKSSDYSIGLHVPGTTKRYQTSYSTTLRWNLTVAP